MKKFTTPKPIGGERTWTKVGESTPILPKAMFEKYVPGFDYGKCMASVKEEVYNVDGEFVYLLFTHEDSCDGGNSYGSVVKSKAK